MNTINRIFQLSLIISLVFFSCKDGKENQTSKKTNSQKTEKNDLQTTAEVQSKNKFIEGSQKNCRCGFMIKHDYYSELDLLNSMGEKIKSIKNDAETEDFIFGDIIDIENGYLEVEIFGKSNGFVENSDNIGFHLANYGEKKIALYQEPNEGKTVINLTDNLRDGFHNILDCKGEWVKVKIGDKTGWVTSDWICGNPYTTCS